MEAFHNVIILHELAICHVVSLPSTKCYINAVILCQQLKRDRAANCPKNFVSESIFEFTEETRNLLGTIRLVPRRLHFLYPNANIQHTIPHPTRAKTKYEVVKLEAGHIFSQVMQPNFS